MMKPIYCFFAALILPIASRAADCGEIGREVVIANQIGLGIRESLDFSKINEESKAVIRRMEVIDAQNGRLVDRYISKCGWPKKSKSEINLIKSTWLLVQHADGNLPLQKRALLLIKDNMRVGEASIDSYVYLADRISVKEKGYQLYGTQVEVKGECQFEFFPFDSRAAAERRRANLKMPSLSDYMAKIKSESVADGCEN